MTLGSDVSRASADCPFVVCSVVVVSIAPPYEAIVAYEALALRRVGGSVLWKGAANRKRIACQQIPLADKQMLTDAFEA
jgi:hypothetical protein